VQNSRHSLTRGDTTVKPSSNLSLFIGKSVRDEYGRQIGRIASFAINPNGRIKGVFVQQENGGFSRYSGDQFRISGDDVVFLPLIKLRVEALCNEIPLIWRKNQALNELIEKKKIPPEMFDDLHENFEGALKQLKTDADGILKDVEERIVKSAQQIKELNSALIHLEIEREIGKINDESYRTAMMMIQGGLKQANAEKNDLEVMRKHLYNITLGEKTATKAQTEEEKEVVPTEATSSTSTPPEPSSLPEPPVIVYVKGADKQNP
jgi:sporulation protein YlmC with PRC-barrel domain